MRMAYQRWLMIAVIGMGWTAAHAGDWKINIPRRSKPTPVQRLNREGVEAVKRHDLEKAKSLFYRAYLLDPDDPFTLNNLGYISELDGQAKQAENYYALASRERTNAVVDLASSKRMEGQFFLAAVNGAQNASFEANRANISAVALLSEGRVSEAEAELQHALVLDRQNPFTLNNLGVTKEMEGDFIGALTFYQEAAALHSTEPAIVSQGGASRGKEVSEMAADAAKRLSQRMNTLETPEEQASLLNLRGVTALNRNDREAATQDFLRAYALDPNGAFSLNNAGYLAEMEGDLETAQIFYERARAAQKADAKVGLASRRSAEGVKLFQVADESNQNVEVKIDELSAARHRETGPIVLRRRDGTPVDEPSEPPQPQPLTPRNNQPH